MASGSIGLLVACFLLNRYRYISSFSFSLLFKIINTFVASSGTLIFVSDGSVVNPGPSHFGSITAVMGLNTIMIECQRQELVKAREAFRLNVFLEHLFCGIDYTIYNYKWTHTGSTCTMIYVLNVTL